MNGVTFNSGFSAGIYGMRLASHGLQQSAQQIAAATVENKDGGAAINASINRGSNTTESLINLQSSVLMFKASAKVVDATDEALGTLLDVRA